MALGGVRSTEPAASHGSAPEVRPLRPEEASVAIEQRAKEILKSHADTPIGTSVPFDLDGRSYLARIEEHYHEPGGPLKPWGYHRGVTVYVTDSTARSAGP